MILVPRLGEQDVTYWSTHCSRPHKFVDVSDYVNQEVPNIRDKLWSNLRDDGLEFPGWREERVRRTQTQTEPRKL